MIFKIEIIDKMPLASSVLKRPLITFTRKINPFRMPKFIPHKIEIAAIGRCQGNKPYHFVKRYAAVNPNTLIRHAHVLIHI